MTIERKMEGTEGETQILDIKRRPRKRRTTKIGPVYPSCNHTSKTYSCHLITNADAEKFHDAFYIKSNRMLQDSILLKYTVSESPQRKRKRNCMMRKGVTTKYYIETEENGVVQVCQNAFLGILRVSKDRVQRLVKQNLPTTTPNPQQNGNLPPVNNEEKEAAIKTFFKKFRSGDTAGEVRQYLLNDLNANEVLRMYNEEAPEELKVSPSFFKNLFNETFIRFKAPHSESSSSCIEPVEENEEDINVKKESGEADERDELDNLRENLFFHLLREEK